MKTKTDPRHAGRRIALTSIFCWLFSDSADELAVGLSKDLLQEKAPDFPQVRSVVVHEAGL